MALVALAVAVVRMKVARPHQVLTVIRVAAEAPVLLVALVELEELAEQGQFLSAHRVSRLALFSWWIMALERLPEERLAPVAPVAPVAAVAPVVVEEVVVEVLHGFS